MQSLSAIKESLNEVLRSNATMHYSLEPCASESSIYYGAIDITPDWLIAKRKAEAEAALQAERQRRGTGVPVDLGLSVLWSSRNVGAPSGDQPGYYVGWGDVSARQTSTNENDYPLAQNICGTRYDIARTMYAETWRLPTVQEMTELMQQCQWIWTQINGVTGFQVVGKTGNSIFLPAGGNRYGMEYEDAYYYGRYWCGECGDDQYHRAFLLEFSQMGGDIITMGRFMGMLVRPVLERASK